MAFIVGLLIPTMNVSGQHQKISFDQWVDMYKDPQKYPDFIMVCAHRGYWKDRPENSLSAIDSAISLGVGMVELDLKLTKDGVIMLAHDYYFGRITTYAVGASSQLLSDYTFDQIRNTYKIKLLDPLGNPTDEDMPTLSEALDRCKDKILVNLDKADLTNAAMKETPFLDKVFTLVQQKDMFNQVVVKARADVWTPANLKSTFPSVNWSYMMLTPIYFPDIRIPGAPYPPTLVDFQNSMNGFFNDPAMNVPGVELIYGNGTDVLAQCVPLLQQKNKQIIQFPIWPETAGGNWVPYRQRWVRPKPGDNKRNMEWDWLFHEGPPLTLVISDRLEILVDYLTRIGKQKMPQ